MISNMLKNLRNSQESLSQTTVVLLSVLGVIALILTLIIIILSTEIEGYCTLAIRAQQQQQQTFCDIQATSITLNQEILLRDSAQDPTLHLAVDLKKKLLFLACEGVSLREMPIVTTPSFSTNLAQIALAQGKYNLTGVSNIGVVIPPGTIQIRASDLNAIRANLYSGLTVYCY